MARKKLTREQVMRRRPYSSILACLADKMVMGEGATFTELLKKEFPLYGQNKFENNKSIDKARLHKVLKVLKFHNLVQKIGKRYYLNTDKNQSLATDVDRIILTANDIVYAGQNAQLVFPSKCGESIVNPFKKDVQNQMKALGNKWAIYLIYELRECVLRQIIFEPNKNPNLPKIAYALVRFHERLTNEFMQLGWVIEEKESVDKSLSSNFNDVKFVKVVRVNERQLKDRKLRALVKMLYDNSGLGMIEDVHFQDRIRKSIESMAIRNKNGKKGKRKITENTKRDIRELIDNIVKPLMEMNGPLIMSRIALPCYDVRK
ncbi:MAG: hypothetical protein HPY73_03250 [Methanomassiliicoccales archaeon]|nr:MAG: hypothetical protein HPY73_03250 [Methanomassiliicoccales archaeon]